MNPNESSLITLESVKSQFAEWRATYGKGHRIPPSLWKAVGELTKSYSYQHIASEIKIGSHRLRKKCALPSQELPSLPASPFVEVAFPSLSSSNKTPSLEPRGIDSHTSPGTLELTRTDGTSLKVSGLDHKALCSLIQGFLNP